MKIVYEKTKYHTMAFVFDFSYEILNFCRALKDQHGFRKFTFYEGKWRFSEIDIGWQIKQRFEQVEIEEKLTVHFLKRRAEIVADETKKETAEIIKNKESSDINIKGLKMPLYEYQKLGVEFFDNNDGKAILADQMGTGKTAQSLAYVVYKKDTIKKTLVICPASVKYNWAAETEKWTHLKPYILKSQMKKKEEAELPVHMREDEVFIVNFDSLKKFLPLLSAYRFDCLIVDECHYIKSNTAMRTKLVKEIAKHIPKVLLLSGTPLLSRPVELYNSLLIMDPRTWGNWFDYTKRYCGAFRGMWGYDTSGATNIDELRTRIQRYFLRRTKDDVLKELPQKQFTNIPVELPNDVRFQYDLIMESFEEYLHDVKKKNSEQIRRSMQAEKLVRLSELRSITTAGKMDAAKELIQNIIESGEKVLVFSCYNEPLEKLHALYEKESFLLTGKTDELIRGEMVKKFQADPEKKIFFGGIKSAGVGITLTAANNVIFLDYSWTPADHAQAMDRVHRPGQKASAINVYQLFAMDTIDQYMKETLDKKQAIFDKLFNSSDDSVALEAKEVSLFTDIMDRIEANIKKI